MISKLMCVLKSTSYFYLFACLKLNVKNVSSYYTLAWPEEQI